MMAFGNERFELEQYEVAVEAARKGGVRHGLELGISTGWMLGGHHVYRQPGLQVRCEAAVLRRDEPPRWRAVGGGRHPLHLLRRADGQFLRRSDARCSGSRFSAVLRHEGAIQGSLKGAGN